MRWAAWRNRVIASEGFQSFAARMPLLRPVARRRASALFDLLAGFTYTQTLLAFVESGMLELLGEGPCALERVASHTQLSPAATERLVRAAAALDLAEEVAPGWWTLGQQGAALSSNAGALAMVRHHALLYADLTDPLALLRQDREEPTKLSEFWRYAAREDPAAQGEDAVSPYSQLMATSQAMVAREVLAAYDFDRHASVLDIGGGHGVFLKALAHRFPRPRLGLMDLPGVIDGARRNCADLADAGRVEFHPGSFSADPIPGGYDCITLVRILHDHDDEPVVRLLSAIRKALAPGGRLVIAEPMSGTRGAEAMGDAYFGLYLWAMRSGRPRTRQEIGSLLKAAGFPGFRLVRTSQPVVTSLIVTSALHT
ncbi:methyltransferase [Aurantiacibacter zhengii]|uniref:Methyltransferase domain-containing protein n=2 Tax=Aurantiacibacter zhengii TaxID=2307003 RepID=A0A418NRM5_9SPHN|nr:methyltransferase [Aurantiacibacter zhengii]RIV85592.1 methyltransferase domain-containing protein [Aurantiacibacter zhengii]